MPMLVRILVQSESLLAIVERLLKWLVDLHHRMDSVLADLAGSNQVRSNGLESVSDSTLAYIRL